MQLTLLARILSLDDSSPSKDVLLFYADHPVPKSWVVKSWVISCCNWLKDVCLSSFEDLVNHPPSKLGWKKLLVTQLHSSIRDDFLQVANSAQLLSELRWVDIPRFGRLFSSSCILMVIPT